MVLTQSIQQELSEIIISHLTVHACLQPVSRCTDCHIARRATRVAYVASFLLSGKEINQHLTNCNKIHTFSYLSALRLQVSVFL